MPSIRLMAPLAYSCQTHTSFVKRPTRVLAEKNHTTNNTCFGNRFIIPVILFLFGVFGAFHTFKGEPPADPASQIESGISGGQGSFQSDNGDSTTILNTNVIDGDSEESQ